MPHRDTAARLRDILRAAKEIQEFTSGIDFAEFAATRRTVLAVLYDLVVIGEAAGHIPQEFSAEHAAVPWAAMQRMRNVVAHRYFAVDLDIVWETARSDVPSLIAALERVLGEDVPGS